MTFKMTGASPNAQNTNAAANQYLVTFPVSSTCWSYLYYEADTFPRSKHKIVWLIQDYLSTACTALGLQRCPAAAAPHRQRVAGYYCPTTTVQLPCQDIYFYPTGYGGYLGGNYVLQPACKTLPKYEYQCTSNLINGFPYYINYQSNLFLAYYPQVSRPLLSHNPLFLFCTTF